MSKHFLVTLLSSSLALLLSSCTSLKPPSEHQLINDDYSLVKKYMTRFIDREIKHGDITGLSIALIDDQKLVWSEGFGLADKANQRDATPDTLYRAGSVSKLFTALATMQLVEAGKIDLDAPLAEYVPEFKLKSRHGTTDTITLRNVLSHHSGIPSDIIDGMWAEQPDSFKTVATRLSDYYSATPPDTVFSYSNVGYSLAGHAVENTSGEPYSAYVTQHVLTPLGMGNSNISLNTENALLAKSYWKGDEFDELPLRDLPAGGLVTNVVDLSRLVMEIHSLHAGKPGVIQPNSYSSMVTPGQYNSPYVIDNINGLGFFVTRQMLNGQFAAVGHDGQTMAHSATMISIPDIKLGVVILGNSPDRSGTFHRIADELLKVAYPVKTGRSLDKSTKSSTTPLPGKKTNFNGDFISELGFIRITGDTSNYTVSVGDETMKLKPVKTGGYQLSVKVLGFLSLSPGPLKKLRFYAREANNKKFLVIDNGTHRQLIATQVATQPQNTAWHTRLGEYTITNPIPTDIDMLELKRPALQYRDGYYMIASNDSEDNTRLLLNIINDNEATIQGLGRGMGETVLVKEDGTIVHAGLIFKKL